MVSMKAVKKKKSAKKVNLHQIYVDDQIWDQVKPYLDEIGLSRSKYIQMTFQYLINAHTKTMVEAFGNVQDELFTIARVKGKLKE